jgi:protein import protein ZIM17
LCKNHVDVFCTCRHLIADHLSWFKDSTDGGRLRTVEDIVKAHGEKVRRGELKIGDGDEGVLEFAD